MLEVLLRELYARALGVIGEARLEFAEGFSVLTGETGAGKTLLLGALELSLGLEGTGTRLAISSETHTTALFERRGREIALSRESGASGRLRSTLNGAPSSAEGLRATAEELIVIHGQHDSLSLRNRVDVLRLIDAAGGVDTTTLDLVRQELRVARDERVRSGGDALTQARELEFLDFQLAELNAAKLTSRDELPEKLDQLTRLGALRDGQAQLVDVLEELDGEADDALLVRLARTIARLPRDAAYEEPRHLLDSALDQAREAVRELTSLNEPSAFDEGIIVELEARVTQLQLLARKYGGSFDDLFATLNHLTERRTVLEHARERAQSIDDIISKLEESERTLAREVLREREYGATTLTNAVRAQLPRVALPNASVRFVAAGDDGSDAQILFSANPGQPEGPLATLASGGELSRVLLAISLETAHSDVVAVFDEIDAGIGGQVAQQIGECLAELATRQQVLAVTHLASVASRANHHFVVDKSIVNGVTSTTVRKLTAEERVNEIARMLSGSQTDESRALATQLLSHGQGMRS